MERGQTEPSPFSVQLQIDAIYENFCALNCKYKCTSVQSLSFLCTSPSYAKAISLFWQVCFRFRPSSYLDFLAIFLFFLLFPIFCTPDLAPEFFPFCHSCIVRQIKRIASDLICFHIENTSDFICHRSNHFKVASELRMRTKSNSQLMTVICI